MDPIVLVISLLIVVYTFMWMQQMLRFQREQRQLLSAISRMMEKSLNEKGISSNVIELMKLHDKKA